MSISRVLDELTNTPVSTSTIASGEGNNKEILISAGIAVSAQSEHRPPSEIMKSPKPSGETNTDDPTTEQKDRHEKKLSSGGSAVKNIISHFMSASVAGQVIPVCSSYKIKPSEISTLILISNYFLLVTLVAN